MVLTAGPNQAHVGDTVALTLTIRNLGGSSAHNLWLTDAYDKRFELVSYTSRVPRTGTDVLNWSYVDFQPGEVEMVTLILRPAAGTSAGSLIPAVFEAVYTDSGDTVIGYVRSNTATVAVLYSGKGASWIRKRVRSVLDRVEAAYGSILQSWDGDMDKVVGARDLIREYLLKTNRRGLLRTFASS